jgi:hypothetical protein
MQFAGMHQNRKTVKNKFLNQVLFVLMLLIVTAGVPAPSAQGQGSWSIFLPVLMNPSAVFQPSTDLCRFGITTRSDLSGYLDLTHLNQLQAGSLIDWSSRRPATLPADKFYLHVITTGVKYYATILTTLPLNLKAYPGETWQVGNEPDTKYQDNATPEQYAEQFFAIATVIRANDPSAKIAFGTVVQPTPLRRVYLDRAWTRLTQLAGGPAQASALVDIWSIHAFLLGEKPGEWGTGLPLGMDGTEAELLRFGPGYHDYAETHDVNLLAGLIRDFRTWLAAKGERAKPLWITEYGVAFPPIDPPTRDIYNVSDADTAAYMIATFDFFRGTTDAATGVPSDNNLLVQRWFWYTMNEQRYKFGGVLYDPDNGNQITAVGQAYINYTASFPRGHNCNP